MNLYFILFTLSYSVNPIINVTPIIQQKLISLNARTDNHPNISGILKVEGLPGFDKLIPIASSGLYCFMSLGKHVHMYLHVYMYMHSCIHVYAFIHTYTNKHTHTYSHVRTHTHAYTHTHSLPPPSTHTHVLFSYIPLSCLFPSFSYSHFLTPPSNSSPLHSTHCLEFAGCKPMKTTKVSVAGRSNLTVNFEEELWIPVWYGINFFCFLFLYLFMLF